MLKPIRVFAFCAVVCGAEDRIAKGDPGMIHPMFIALPLAVAGFHAIRRGTLKNAAKRPIASKLTGTALLATAGFVMAIGCEATVIGAMLWLFCVLPLAALPATLVRTKSCWRKPNDRLDVCVSKSNDHSTASASRFTDFGKAAAFYP